MENREGSALISVIIPAYNAEETIQRACDSVFSQNYPNVELIVVNDGSKDRTGEIVDALQRMHPNMRCIHQKNGGVCKARNTGMDQARGEYIAFLDADDALTQDCLSRLYAAAAEHNCDIVTGNSDRVRTGESSGEKAFDFGRDTCVWTGLEPLEHSLADHPATYAVWGKLYRKAALGDVRFTEGKRIHEDSFFLFEVFLRRVNMAVVDDIVIHQYVTEDSASRVSFSEKFLDILYFANQKYEIIRRDYPAYLPLAENTRIKACLALLNVMCTTKNPKYNPIEKECLETVRRNAKYFIPAIPRDRVLFMIVRYRLYGLYKAVHQIYRKLRG